jgi:hypothetical protein
MRIVQLCVLVYFAGGLGRAQEFCGVPKLRASTVAAARGNNAHVRRYRPGKGNSAVIWEKRKLARAQLGLKSDR